MKGTGRWTRIERLLAALKDRLMPRLPSVLRWASREQYATEPKGITRHEDGSVSVALAWAEDLDRQAPFGPHDYSKVEEVGK